MSRAIAAAGAKRRAESQDSGSEVRLSKASRTDLVAEPGLVSAGTSGIARPAKRSGRQGSAFTDSQRALLKQGLRVNGEKPTTLGNVEVIH